MPKFLVSIHRSRDYDPLRQEDDVMAREIDALNQEMRDAGVRTFAGGLQPPSTAKSIRCHSDGKIIVADGLYLDATEHVGGFWILDVAHAEDAMAWGQKASRACRASVEVRPFH